MLSGVFLLISISLFSFSTLCTASFCGESAVPFSFEALPDGHPVLGCARPACFGWDLHGHALRNASSKAGKALFHRVQHQPDGFLRNQAQLAVPAADAGGFRAQIARCPATFASDGQCPTEAEHWVSGIAPMVDAEKSAFRLRCCGYDGLKLSTDRGVATVKAGQIVFGGEVAHGLRQYAFDYVSNINRAEEEGLFYEVSVRRMPCLPRPNTFNPKVSEGLEKELLKRLVLALAQEDGEKERPKGMIKTSNLKMLVAAGHQQQEESADFRYAPPARHAPDNLVEEEEAENELASVSPPPPLNHRVYGPRSFTRHPNVTRPPTNTQIMPYYQPSNNNDYNHNDRNQYYYPMMEAQGYYQQQQQPQQGSRRPSCAGLRWPLGRAKRMACDLEMPQIQTMDSCGTESCCCQPMYCFSANTEVQLVDGTRKRMDQLVLGDWVASTNGSQIVYSMVESWIHRLPDQEAEFVELELEDGRMLQLTDQHYIYAAKCDKFGELVPVAQAQARMVYAEQVRSGECVFVQDEFDSPHTLRARRVRRVGRVRSRGIFAPLTGTGDILAQGVLASCYSVQPNQVLQQSVFNKLGSSPLVDRLFGHISEEETELPAWLRLMVEHVMPFVVPK